MWDRRFWGTAVNPEAKLLMLSHLFDDCGFGRVKIQTDAVDLHSQAAIAKLGAQKEGVLRRHTRGADDVPRHRRLRRRRRRLADGEGGLGGSPAQGLTLKEIAGSATGMSFSDQRVRRRAVSAGR